jgi:hypothetical protein
VFYKPKMMFRSSNDNMQISKHVNVLAVMQHCKLLSLHTWE